jgi:cell division protein FtsW
MMRSRYESAPPLHDEEYYQPLERPARRPQYKPREMARPRPKQNVDVGNLDVTIYLVVTILVLIGVVMVFSSSFTMAANSRRFNYDAYHFLQRNIVFAIMGFVAMNIIARVHYKIMRKFVWALYFVAVAGLVMVIGGGIAVGNVYRWLEIPIIGQFQPSEVAKAAIIFIIAHLVDKYPGALKSWSNLFIFSATVAIIVVLVLLPGGFSTALIIATIGFGMIFIASPYILRFFVLGGVGVGLVAAYLGITAYLGTGFRGARVSAWLDPWSDPLEYGFQPIQSLYAVASGGWFGLGIGESRQASFIPEPQNDMIFAIIVEELGLVGAGLILILFAIFIWRGIMVALRAPDTFSSMLAIGIVLAIAFQTVINVAVVTNTIPNTGVTLPFISYGGTSLMVTMALAGVLLSISKYSKAEPGGRK